MDSFQWFGAAIFFEEKEQKAIIFAQVRRKSFIKNHLSGDSWHVFHGSFLQSWHAFYTSFLQFGAPFYREEKGQNAIIFTLVQTKYFFLEELGITFLQDHGKLFRGYTQISHNSPPNLS